MQPMEFKPIKIQPALDVASLRPGDVLFYENMMSQHGAIYYGKLNDFDYVIHSISDGKQDACVKLSLLKFVSLETITVYRPTNKVLAKKAVELMWLWFIDKVKFSHSHTNLWKRVASLKEFAVIKGNLNHYLTTLSKRATFSYFRALKMAARTLHYTPTKNKGMTCIEAIILSYQVAAIKDHIIDIVGDLSNPYLHVTDKRRYDIATAPTDYQNYHFD